MCVQESPHLENVFGFFLASLASGTPLSVALWLWARPSIPGSYSSSGSAFLAVPPAQPIGWIKVVVLLLEPTQQVQVYFNKDGLIGLHSTALLRSGSFDLHFPMRGPPRVNPSFTRFMHEHCRMDFSGSGGGLVAPRLVVAQLYEHRSAWQRRLGSLSSEVLMLIEGRCVIPKKTFPFHGTHSKNLPSWQLPEVQSALWPVIAKWLWAGTLEYCSPGDKVPKFILPCGGVPKATAPFWRLITDGRPVNNFFDDWPSKNTALAELCFLLSSRPYTFSRDIHNAYHLVPLSGCFTPGSPYVWQRPLGIWVEPGEQTSSAPVLRSCFGCSPSSCTGNCDKNLFGIQLNGHTMLFASFQFGIKVAGSPLSTLLRSVVHRIEESEFHPRVAHWVDNLLGVVSVPEHASCLGSVGGCPVCLQFSADATASEQFTDGLLHDLGIPLSDKGHPASQQGCFTGIRHDTVKGLFLIPEDKLARLGTALAALLDSDSATAREIAGVRGRLQHYSVCLPYQAPIIVELSRSLGTHEYPSANKSFNWDMHIELSARLKRLLNISLDRALRWASVGRPIWPEIASSLYGEFVDGSCPMSSAPGVITYDASFQAGAARIWLPGITEPLEFFCDTSSLHDQVHREAFTGLHATKFAITKAQEYADSLSFQGRHLIL